MKNLIGFIGGTIFSIGLVISGMTNPKKVLGFLDIFRNWDYSLAFVMGGAVFINLIFFSKILKRRPFLNNEHLIPSNLKIDRKLVVGSAMFGIGWGLIGICPGPGIVNLVTLNQNALIFIISLLMGMFIHKLFIKLIR